MRAWLLVVAVVASLTGCGRVCPDGSEPTDDVCVAPVDSDSDVVDTEVVDTEVVDTDVGPETSPVKLTWVTNRVPNANVVIVECGGRRILRESNFTFATTHEKLFDLAPGQTCQVILLDADGGALPAGSLTVCSKEIATWDEERGRRRELEPFEVFACTTGCTDEVAENYDPNANLDDGSCEYVEGCTDPEALNYDPNATKDDGTCDFGGFGLLEIDLYVDGSPADTIVHVVCDGDEVLTVVPDVRYPWTTQHLTQITEAGHVCVIQVEDAAGNAGPAGQAWLCGVPEVSWAPTSGQAGKPYVAEVGAFRTEACSGCTDPLATNFDADAVVEDGTCVY